MQRETIEWLNYWIEEANSEKKRILLIGDSVTRQYRKTLNDISRSRGYVVDIVATSYGMTDPLLFEELSHFINVIHYDYEIIIFHLGAHHGYCMDCKNSSKDKESYEFHLRSILNMLAKESVRLATVAGTPEREFDAMGERVKNHNDEIRERNKILKEVSEQENYIFIDLYQCMMKHRYDHVDLFHYVRSTDEYMANRIVEALFGQPMKEIFFFFFSLHEFHNILNQYEKFYIYGAGKRGNILEQYMKFENKKTYGYIVSSEFYNAAEKEYLLSDIEPDEDTLIIVTPTDYEIYASLHNWGRGNYVSLADRIYICLEEYVNAHKNL